MIIVTDLVLSYHILMSIVTIGLIVLKFLTAKNSFHDSIVIFALDRDTS